MRYLKKYKVFESEGMEDADYIMSILKDKVLPISDKDLKVSISKSIGGIIGMNYYPNIDLLISTEEEFRKFNLNDIKDEIFDIIDIMENNNWDISSAEVIYGMFRTASFPIQGIAIRSDYTWQRDPVTKFKIQFKKI